MTRAGKGGVGSFGAPNGGTGGDGGAGGEGGALANRNGATLTIEASLVAGYAAGAGGAGGTGGTGGQGVPGLTFPCEIGGPPQPGGAGSPGFPGGVGGTGGSGGSAGAIANRGTLSVTNSTFFGNLRGAGGSAGSAGAGGPGGPGGMICSVGPTGPQGTPGTPGTSGSSGTVDALSVLGGTASFTATTLAEAANTVALARLAGSVTLAQTIATGQCTGTITDAGHNLTATTTTCPSKVGDPLLGPLQDNGGPTDTKAPTDASPALDGGPATGCPATDQRGAPRPSGAACDIGAFERTIPPPPGAGDGGGSGAGAGGGSAAPAAPAATLTGLKLTPKSFRAASASAGGPFTTAKTTRGTSVRFTLSAAATVDFTVSRERRGTRSGKSCVAPKKGKIVKKSKRCTRLVPAGSFSSTLVGGAITLRFTGRIGTKALTPGAYVLALRPKGGAETTSRFTVLKPAKR